MVSTKTMASSFGKNLPNRFEESYGDAGNLRGRYPLAAIGFFFLQRSSIVTDEPAAFEFSCDMIRKLRDDGDKNGYTATGSSSSTGTLQRPSMFNRAPILFLWIFGLSNSF